MKIVSACLAGEKCNYKGEASPCKEVMDLVARGDAIAVCPEVLGGLSTPRTPAELQGDRVMTKEGIDVTEAFEIGAEKTLEMCKENNCTEAILKARSPSCGVGKIYDGTFSDTLVDGDGVCAALLKENNIAVLSEDDLQKHDEK